jgi:antirestriction protein ArdC
MKPETEVKVNEAVNRIVEMFETGNLPVSVAQTVLHRQAGDTPSSTWSLGNLLLMLSTGTTDARGFNQWKAAGRSVKKGSKALYILGPATRKIVVEEDGKQVEKVIVSGFFGIPVFKYEDTEGAEVPRVDYNPSSMPPLTNVAQSFGVRVDYGPCAGSYRGYFKPSENRIMLCTHDVRTWFHELAHAVHNAFRPLRGGQDPSQEIVAETVAATLCSLYGFEGYIYHGAEYIKGYANGQNPGKAVLKVLADVQKCLTLILEAESKVPALSA